MGAGIEPRCSDVSGGVVLKYRTNSALDWAPNVQSGADVGVSVKAASATGDFIFGIRTGGGGQRVIEKPVQSVHRLLRAIQRQLYLRKTPFFACFLSFWFTSAEKLNI